VKTRTKRISRTRETIGRFSFTQIQGKDPNFDYSFQKIEDVEKGGGATFTGYEPVSEKNYAGETWGGPPSMQVRSRATKEIRYLDTIACKRDKETSAFFKRLEDEKYNAQCNLILSANQRVQVSLRQLDPGSVVVNRTTGLEKAMKQRPGPSQEV